MTAGRIKSESDVKYTVNLSEIQIPIKMIKREENIFVGNLFCSKIKEDRSDKFNLILFAGHCTLMLNDYYRFVIQRRQYGKIRQYPLAMMI